LERSLHHREKPEIAYSGQRVAGAVCPAALSTLIHKFAHVFLGSDRTEHDAAELCNPLRCRNL
jgi:hypothetical protein